MPDRVEQWLNRFKPVTKSGYTAAANRFQAFFPAGPIGLRDAGQGRANEILADWRQSMIDAGGAAATINQRLAAIRSFLASERRAGRINWTPDVKNMPYEPYRDTQGPGREVIQKMIAFCDSSYRGRRNAVLIRLLHDLALRSSEVISLDLEHVDMAKNRLSVLRKGRVNRGYIPFGKRTKADIIKWLRLRGTEPGPLFLTTGNRRLSQRQLYEVVSTLGGKAGVKTHPHALRHTAITEATKRFSLHESLLFSGHRNPATLGYYMDRNDSNAVTEEVAI